MRDLEADAVGLLAELIAIDSVNPALVPGAAGETRIVAHLRARLDRHGFATTVVPALDAPDRPSLVAVPRRPAKGPVVVLNGHLDTVGVAGMPEPFTPHVTADRLTGRGAADMKGGVAALVAAAEHLVASDSPVRPVLALVADEEDASLGSEAVIAALPGLGIRPDACLIAEPTGLARCRSLRGFAVVRVSFAGRAAHSSQPELGANAITSLGRLLHVVDQQAPAVRAAGGELLVTVVRGGSSPFVVPDRAECIVELRTAPGRPSESALADVRALLADRVTGAGTSSAAPDGATDATADAIAELVACRDGWRLDDDGPAATLAARLERALGMDSAFDAPYWMEAPLWQRICPTLICGPSGGGLHAIDEWVDLGQVRAFAAALVSVLGGWGREAGRPHGD